MTPHISVVMSVYNGECFLKESVESILNQTFEDFELIIINDGSTDSSGKILREYAEKDSRVLFVEQENQGLTYSLNKGISIARGKYIARMDADDISLPIRLDEQYKTLISNPKAVLAACFYEIVNKNGDVIRPVYLRKCIKHRLLNVNRICHSSVMFLKEAFDKTGGYRLKYAQDYDLWLRLREQGDIIVIDRILHKYRFNPSSLSFKERQEQAFFGNLARNCVRIRKEGGSESEFIEREEKEYQKGVFDPSILVLPYISYGLFLLDSGKNREARWWFASALKASKGKSPKSFFYLTVALLPQIFSKRIRKLMWTIIRLC